MENRVYLLNVVQIEFRVMGCQLSQSLPFLSNQRIQQQKTQGCTSAKGTGRLGPNNMHKPSITGRCIKNT